MSPIHRQLLRKMNWMFEKRQTNLNNGGSGDGDTNDQFWGYSPTAFAIKWAIIGAILLLILLWLVGGYYHAQSRVRRGLPPLAYHRFLLPRSQRARFAPQAPPFSFYQHQQGRQGYNEGYPMHAYPPPAYNPETAPPVYQPPDETSKVNPNQDWNAAPPSGPPPGHADAGHSSSA